MSVITRGVRNTFRNTIRSGSVVLILALSIGLALSMLVAQQSVQHRLEDLKKNLGTTVTIRPAGSANMQGGGEPLTNDMLQKVTQVAHVQSADGFVNFSLQTEGADTGQVMLRFMGPQTSGKTNLISATEPGTLGRRLNGQTPPADIKLPIRGTGIGGAMNESGQQISLTSGRQFEANDTDVALIGKDLAAKNNIQVNSTFTAYGKTFTVVGIFDAGTKFENDTLYVPLKTIQQQADQPNELATIVARADSLDNLASVISSIKSTLGEDKVDVTSSGEQASQTIESLQSVERISIVGFVVALIAAGLVIFLTMLMIVRERRREIGVLKAIGASNRTVVSQFIVESMVLVTLGALVGVGVATVASSGITSALVSSSNSSTAQETPAGPQRQGLSIGSRRMNAGPQPTQQLEGQVAVMVGWSTILLGLVGALVVAVIGSAVPAWFISKVQPAEVLRGE